MALKGFKRFYKESSHRAETGGVAVVVVGGCVCVAAMFCFGEIGELEGYGRPGDMRDTHSLKWPHDGFGPPLFNDMAP